MVACDPSMEADSLLQSEVLRDAARLRLGMPILDGGGCAMCTHTRDDRGHHCLACMASGHKQLMHTTHCVTLCIDMQSWQVPDLTWNQLDYCHLIHNFVPQMS